MMSSPAIFSDARLFDFLFTVATTYDRTAGLDASAQHILRAAPKHLAGLVPETLKIVGSGGKGLATYTPWVGIFDSDETSSPHYGVYVVYLFSEDLEHVTLTLNQGMERLRKEYGDKTARELLQSQADAVRSMLGKKSLEGLKTSMSLRSDGNRQRAYEAGNIACLTYETDNLPPEEVLQKDLSRMLDLYRTAVVARQSSLSLMSDLEISGSSNATAGGLLTDFRPKDSGDYVTQLSGKLMTKSRKHEDLVKRFGEHASSNGFKAATPHPRDVTLKKDDIEWLVEAKVVYRGNATEAVRSAIGQLMTYRHFLYGAENPPRLVALFSEEVGQAYIELLTSLGIATCWADNKRWKIVALDVRDPIVDLATSPEKSR